MRVLCFLFVILFTNKITAGSLTELAGDLPKVISADKSPYVVITDLYVPAGKIVRIEPGTVLLFKNFTGIHVRGILIAKGTSSHPIIFSSENDQVYNPSATLNPTPFDWNGIYIHRDGIGTDLEQIRVSYSVKGIISETKFIRISEGVFSENGRSNCTIEGEEAQITASVPFNHNMSIKDATVDGVPVKILKDPDAPKRNTFRYCGLGLCVGGAVVATLFGYQWYRVCQDLDSLCKDQNLRLNYNGDKIIHDKEKTRNRNSILFATGGVLTVAGGISLIYSFTF